MLCSATLACSACCLRLSGRRPDRRGLEPLAYACAAVFEENCAEICDLVVERVVRGGAGKPP